MAETSTDPSMAIRKFKTCGFGSGSPVSALMPSLSRECSTTMRGGQQSEEWEFALVVAVEVIAVYELAVGSPQTGTVIHYSL